MLPVLKTCTGILDRSMYILQDCIFSYLRINKIQIHVQLVHTELH